MVAVAVEAEAAEESSRDRSIKLRYLLIWELHLNPVFVYLFQKGTMNIVLLQYKYYIFQSFHTRINNDKKIIFLSYIDFAV